MRRDDLLILDAGDVLRAVRAIDEAHRLTDYPQTIRSRAAALIGRGGLRSLDLERRLLRGPTLPVEALESERIIAGRIVGRLLEDGWVDVERPLEEAVVESILSLGTTGLAGLRRADEIDPTEATP